MKNYIKYMGDYWQNWDISYKEHILKWTSLVLQQITYK